MGMELWLMSYCLDWFPKMYVILSSSFGSLAEFLSTFMSPLGTDLINEHNLFRDVGKNGHWKTKKDLFCVLLIDHKSIL